MKETKFYLWHTDLEKFVLIVEGIRYLLDKFSPEILFETEIELAERLDDSICHTSNKFYFTELEFKKCNIIYEY